MFTNYRILDIFDYICVRNAQCWVRITKSDMEIQRYNRVGHTVSVPCYRDFQKAMQTESETMQSLNELLKTLTSNKQ